MVNNELQEVTKWLHTNKLIVITYNKTHFAFRKNKNLNEESLKFYLDNVSINRKEAVKTLGLIINESVLKKNIS